MRSLDEFYRYIEKQEQALRSSVAEPINGEAAEPSADAEAEFGDSEGAREDTERPEAASDTPRVDPPLAAVPVAVPPGRRVRYIIRGGMTVAVPVDDGAAQEATSGSGVAFLRRRTDLETMSGKLDAAPPPSADRSQGIPDYLPPLVEGQEPTLVADSPARPRKSGTGPWHRSARAEEAASSEAPLSDGDAAALWQRIPRHIQILVSMEEAQEEVAQKYYARGFKETRRQLIERLLDPTLTLEDTARVLGVCPTTVRRYTNKGLLPHHRTVGQQRRFRLSDVLAFVEQQQRKGTRDEG